MIKPALHVSMTNTYRTMSAETNVNRINKDYNI